MNWNIDGTEIEIQVSAVEEPLVKYWDEGKKIVCLPGRLTKEEAVWTLKNILLDKQQQQPHQSSNEYWEIFDKKWLVEISKTVAAPCISNGMIKCSSSSGVISSRQKDYIIQTLLKQFIEDQMARWEEYFSCLFPQIKFRKLHRNAFVYSSNCISFDKKLHRYSKDILAYVVFTAISKLIAFGHKDEADILIKHFPQAKQYQKILDHDYAS